MFIRLRTRYTTPGKTTLEHIISKEPLVYLLQIIHIPEEGKEISAAIRNGIIAIV